MSRAPRWALAAAAIAGSALLLALFARAEAPWHWVGFFALLPALLALDGASSWRRGALLGVALSAAYALAVEPWFAEAVHAYTQAPRWLCGLLLLLLAPLLQPQLVAWASVRAGVARRRPRLAPFAAACAYVGVEWALPKLFGDTLGYGLYPAEWLRQSADLFGARGLTLLLLLGNEAALAIVTAAKVRTPQARRAAARWGAALVASLAALSAYGAWRYARFDPARAGEAVRLAAVQANLTHYADLAQRLGTYGAVREILDTHYALSDRALAAGRVDALVWPETVYPTTFGAPQSEEGAELDAEIARFSQEHKVPLVFGAYARDEGAEYNAAVFLDGPRAPRTYRKAMLFPLTEWVPELLDGPRFREWFPWAGTWRRGPGPATVELALADGRAILVGPLICYDAVSPGFAASEVRSGARLLLTLSNDSWFHGTPAARLHLIVAAFRSIETRTAQLRATNSGISAAIDARGELIASTREGEAEILSAALPLAGGGATLPVRLGDWVGAAALASAIVLAGGSRWRPRFRRTRR